MIAARLLIGVFLAVAPAGTVVAETAGAAPALAAINLLRAEAGLAPVRIEARLACAAQAHARDIAARGTLDHTGADGSGLGDRLLRAGYRYARAAENLARAGPDPREVTRLWHDSPGHRRNMLDPDVSQAGVARRIAPGGAYWVLVLAAPAPPSPQDGENRGGPAGCGPAPGPTRGMTGG